MIGRNPVERGWIGNPEDQAIVQQALEEGADIDSRELTYWNPKLGKQTVLFATRGVELKCVDRLGNEHLAQSQ
jgi:hypothetical protein